jgi:hypothetical protein
MDISAVLIITRSASIAVSGSDADSVTEANAFDSNLPELLQDTQQADMLIRASIIFV